MAYNNYLTLLRITTTITTYHYCLLPPPTVIIMITFTQADQNYTMVLVVLEITKMGCCIMDIVLNIINICHSMMHAISTTVDVEYSL